MTSGEKVFVFWGAMDALALGSYCAFSLHSGRTPFYADIHSFYTHYASFGAAGWMGTLIQGLFLVGLVLLASLAFSAWSFIVKKQINSLFFWCQQTLRLLTLKCSVALFPLLLYFVDDHVILAPVILFLVSEALKIGTVLWAKRQAQVQV